MSSWKQMLCVTAAFGLLVGGLAFALQFVDRGSNDDQPSSPTETQSSPNVLLKFFTTSIQFKDERELGAPATADFCFENSTPDRLTMDVSEQLSESSKAEVCLLKEGELAKLGSWPATFEKAEQEPAFLHNAKDRWQKLEKSKDAVTIPANAKGIVRLTWTSQRAGSQVASFVLQIRKADDPSKPRPVRLSAGLPWTPAVLNSTEFNRIRIGDVLPGSAATATFRCWAPQRDHFHLTIEDPTGDAHFRTSITPLSAQQLREVTAEEFKKSHLTATAKSGYDVTVLVQENVDGKRLEIGPYTHRLLLKTDVAPDQELTLQGMVRGEVEVGDADHEGRVVLGKFPAADGATVTAPVTSTRTDIKLDPPKVQPSYIHVTLSAPQQIGGTLQWQLTVTTETRIPVGPLPADSAVILEFRDPDNPKVMRHVRVPILGAAYE